MRLRTLHSHKENELEGVTEYDCVYCKDKLKYTRRSKVRDKRRGEWERGVLRERKDCQIDRKSSEVDLVCGCGLTGRQVVELCEDIGVYCYVDCPLKENDKQVQSTGERTRKILIERTSEMQHDQRREGTHPLYAWSRVFLDGRCWVKDLLWTRKATVIDRYVYVNRVAVSGFRGDGWIELRSLSGWVVVVDFVVNERLFVVGIVVKVWCGRIVVGWAMVHVHWVYSTGEVIVEERFSGPTGDHEILT